MRHRLDAHPVGINCDRPMKFALLINAAPYTHQASDTAYHFAVAALARGHEIFRVFFYHDGVYNAARLSAPPQDERRIAARWSALAARHDLDMVVCIAAAQRRGLIDASAQKRHGLDANNMSANTEANAMDAENMDANNLDANLTAGFRVAGLGQLIEAGIQADRLVAFGD